MVGAFGLSSPDMSDDDRGVMGNLPRSRPGTRSAKRKTAGGASAKGDTQRKSAASARKATPPRRTAAPRAARPRPAPAAQRPDPVADVVRVAVKVAGAGLEVAAGVLRRLPRP
jgi:hypothetical protein